MSADKMFPRFFSKRVNVLDSLAPKDRGRGVQKVRIILNYDSPQLRGRYVIVAKISIA